MTGLLDSLEQHEFVRRTANPADRRGLVVEITPTGRVVIQELRTIVHHHEKDWLGALPGADLRRYIALLQRIQDSLAAASDGRG